MSERRGSWMQVYSGRPFWPLDPRPEEVHVEDVAHALAYQCRFAGHVISAPYSVAEHSVRCSWIVPPEHALQALLHDATEAYLVDVPRPLKPYLTNYAEIEARLWTVIAERFGVPVELAAEVKLADEVMLATEKRDLMAPSELPWGPLPEPLAGRIVPWDVEVARGQFLARFAELGGAS